MSEVVFELFQLRKKFNKVFSKYSNPKNDDILFLSKFSTVCQNLTKVFFG